MSYKNEGIRTNSPIAYSMDSIAEMLDGIGITQEDQAWLLQSYPPEKIQRHAAYTIYALDRGDKIKNPAAWLKASLRGNWNAPQGFDAQQTVLHFRIDENTWAEMEKYIPCSLCGKDHREKNCPTLKGGTT